MKGKKFISTKETEELFRKVKKLYKEERIDIRKNSGISVDVMQERAEFLWEVYNTDAVMLIDDKLINSIMRGSTDTNKIVLYFLCLVNSMPDIPVELSVKLNLQGQYEKVYNAVIKSESHTNPMLLPALYRVWQQELSYDSSTVEQ